jgi:arylsulfatase A-like enzyme
VSSFRAAQNIFDRTASLWLQRVVVLGIIIATGACSPAEPKVEVDVDVDRPNILVLLADDMGVNDVRMHGNANVVTPNIDRLANENFRFTRFYTAGNTCAPTRASLASGFYPSRIGFGYLGDRSLPPEVITLAELLTDAGYATHHIGKWHLGHDNEEELPLGQGFSTFFGFNSAKEISNPPEGKRGRARYRNPYLTDGISEPKEYEGHLTEILSKHAIDLIHESDGTRPWFINLWFLAPHGPVQPSEQWKERYPDTKEGKYYALISGLDEGVGKILAALEKSGEIDNTIIFFLSDNGGTGVSAPSNDPYFGNKAETYEGSVRVPLIVSLPGNTGGSVVDVITSSNDLYPTIAALAGVPLNHSVDGRSLKPLFENPSGEIEDQTLFWESRAFSPIWASPRDHLSPSPPLLAEGLNFSVLSADGRWRLTKDRALIALFDLAEDPTCHTNVFDEHPDQVEKMVALYQSWSEEMLRSREKLPLSERKRG